LGLDGQNGRKYSKLGVANSITIKCMHETYSVPDFIPIEWMICKIHKSPAFPLNLQIVYSYSHIIWTQSKYYSIYGFSTTSGAINPKMVIE